MLKGCFLYIAHSDGIYFPMYHLPLSQKPWSYGRSAVQLPQICAIFLHRYTKECENWLLPLLTWKVTVWEPNLFRSCDPGRVSFVEGKWTNFLGHGGKYLRLIKSSRGGLVEGCGMSYWDNSARLCSLGWMSLFWVGEPRKHLSLSCHPELSLPWSHLILYTAISRDGGKWLFQFRCALNHLPWEKNLSIYLTLKATWIFKDLR